MKTDKKLKLAVIITGALSVAISAFMNLVFIPVIVENNTIHKIFDMNIGYSNAEAQYFLDCLTTRGWKVYMYRQMPLDFVYPLVYCAFFILLFRLLLKKKTKLFLLPAALAVTDYCENICIIIMLNSKTLPAALTTAAATLTIVKFSLMLLCFAVAIAIIVYLIRKKNKEDEEKQQKKRERKAQREKMKAEKAQERQKAKAEKKAQKEAEKTSEVDETGEELPETQAEEDTQTEPAETPDDDKTVQAEPETQAEEDTKTEPAEE